MHSKCWEHDCNRLFFSEYAFSKTMLCRGVSAVVFHLVRPIDGHPGSWNSHGLFLIYHHMTFLVHSRVMRVCGYYRWQQLQISVIALSPPTSVDAIGQVEDFQGLSHRLLCVSVAEPYGREMQAFFGFLDYDPRRVPSPVRCSVCVVNGR